MKQKLLNNMKRLQKGSISINMIAVVLLFTTFISLSIKSNGLFLKEILVGSLVIGFVMLVSEKNSIEK